METADTLGVLLHVIKHLQEGSLVVRCRPHAGGMVEVSTWERYYQERPRAILWNAAEHEVLRGMLLKYVRVRRLEMGGWASEGVCELDRLRLLLDLRHAARQLRLRRLLDQKLSCPYGRH